MPAPAERPDVSLAVPCYNEEAVLRRTAERLLAEFRSRDVRLELVLVDNGSSDGTADVIDALVAEGHPVVKAVVPENRGYGYGVRVGLAACAGRYIGSIPADGQVDPRDVVNLAEYAVGADEPSLVKARRRFRMDGLQRKVVSVFYNGLINALWLGLGSIDINGTPKLFPREALVRMNLISDDWFLDAEIMIKAKRLGLRVMEFNVFGQMRGGGRSHVGGDTIREFLRNLLAWRFFGIPERGAIGSDESPRAPMRERG